MSRSRVQLIEHAVEDLVLDIVILRDEVAIEELRRLLYLHAGMKYER